MPLKHHTETAYLFLFGLVLCVSGFVVSILPDLPNGLKYWVLALTATILYPIVLMPTFRRNRADYEFRILHWFPAGIFVLWMLLQISHSTWTWIPVLQLGWKASL